MNEDDHDAWCRAGHKEYDVRKVGNSLREGTKVTDFDTSVHTSN